MNKPFPLPDNPYVMVAGVFVVASVLFILLFLFQRRNGTKVRSKLARRKCEKCSGVYGTNLKMNAIDKVGRKGIEDWVWSVKCPHCGYAAQFTRSGEKI